MIKYVLFLGVLLVSQVSLAERSIVTCRDAAGKSAYKGVVDVNSVKSGDKSMTITGKKVTTSEAYKVPTTSLNGLFGSQMDRHARIRGQVGKCDRGMMKVIGLVEEPITLFCAHGTEISQIEDSIRSDLTKSRLYPGKGACLLLLDRESYVELIEGLGL